MWCAGQGALPPRSEGTVVPRCCHHPSPVGAGVLSARRAGACLSPPRTSTGRAAAGPRTIFSSGSTSVCEGRGRSCWQCRVAPQEGLGGGVRGCEGVSAAARPLQSRPVPPGSAQVRRFSEEPRKLFCPGTLWHGAYRHGERKAAGAL